MCVFPKLECFKASDVTSGPKSVHKMYLHMKRQHVHAARRCILSDCPPIQTALGDKSSVHLDETHTEDHTVTHWHAAYIKHQETTTSATRRVKWMNKTIERRGKRRNTVLLSDETFAADDWKISARWAWDTPKESMRSKVHTAQSLSIISQFLFNNQRQVHNQIKQWDATHAARSQATSQRRKKHNILRNASFIDCSGLDASVHV